tara:strand:- start:107 stop:313 length:207 start_codon:yes stop_codon:yes gene_type:complete
MPLNKPMLVTEIVTVLKKSEQNTTNKNKAQLDLAKGLANAIEKYVRSGTITTTVVTTSGAGTGTGVIT